MTSTLPLMQEAPTWRAALLVQLFEWSKEPYRFFYKRNKKAWPLSIEKLGTFPAGTLGKDLHQFLKENHFNLEPKLENHDVMHILLQYPLDVVSEVAMQFFCFASGKKSTYNKLTMLLGLLFLPEYFNEFVKAYLRGLHAYNFHHWDFEHLLNENTNTLRALIFKQKTHNNFII